MMFDGKVTIPFSMEQMQQILSARKAKDLAQPMQQQEPICVIDYKNSSIKDKFFINFISNLRISVRIDLDDSLEKEEKFELLKAYMTAPKLSEIPTLNAVTCVMVMEAKSGIPYEDRQPIFLSKDERKEFADNNGELINRWIEFLDSIPLSIMYFHKGFTENSGRELIQNGDVEIVEDHLFISANIASAIVTPEFLDSYLCYGEIKNNKIFELQMYEPLFDGYSLMSILVNSNSFAFISSLFNGWFTEEEQKEVIKEVEAL